MKEWRIWMTSSETYVEQIGLSENEIRNYLTENIVFEVDEEMEKGLRLYFELAKKHQLIARGKATELHLMITWS